MTDLPVPWWLFWIVAAVVLYTGLIWFFVREATRPRRPPPLPAHDEGHAAREPGTATSAAGPHHGQRSLD